MFNNFYKTLDFSIDKEIEFDSIEDALKTSCPYCGTELEWKLTVKYNEVLNIPDIYGSAFSCGVEFLIMPLHTTDDDIYIIKENLLGKKE